MSQSKKQSVFESVTQTIIGLATSIVGQLVIYPLMGIPVTFSQNLIITAVFFIVSMIRGYLVRRYFNLKEVPEYNELQDAISMLKQTTEFEVLESFRKKVAKLENK